MAKTDGTKIKIIKVGFAVGLGGIVKGMKSAKSLFASALTGFGTIGLAANGIQMAIDVLSKPFSLVSNAENAAAAFEVLTGSAEESAKMVKNINQLAAKTSIGGSGNIQDAAKTMMSFGMATDKVMPSLKAISEITAGSSERFSSLSLAFAQSASAGRLMGQDLLQMINAGFNPLQEISRKTGKSIADLKKEMEGGNISFAMVEDAFLSATQAGGKFYGMSDKMGETVGGQFAQLSSKVVLAFTEISKKLFERFDLTGILQKINQFVDWGIANFDYFYNLGSSIFKTYTDVLKTYIGFWIDVFWSLEPVITAVIDIFFQAFDFLRGLWESSAGYIGTFVSWVKQGWQLLIDGLLTMVYMFEFGFKNAGEIVNFLGNKIAYFVTKTINQIIYFGQMVWHYIKEGFGAVADYLTGWAKWAGNIVGNLVGNVINLFKNLGSIISGKMNLSDVWTPLTDGFVHEAKKWKDMPERVVGDMEKELGAMVDQQGGSIAGKWDDFLKDKFTNQKKITDFLPDMPDLKLDGNLNLNTKDAMEQAGKVGETVAAQVKDIKFGTAAIAGTQESYQTILRSQMNSVDKQAKKKEEAETARNTKEMLIAQKETNQILKRNLKTPVEEVSVIG